MSEDCKHEKWYYTAQGRKCPVIGGCGQIIDKESK